MFSKKEEAIDLEPDSSSSEEKAPDFQEMANSSADEDGLNVEEGTGRHTLMDAGPVCKVEVCKEGSFHDQHTLEEDTECNDPFFAQAAPPKAKPISTTRVKSSAQAAPRREKKPKAARRDRAGKHREKKEEKEKKEKK